MKGKEIKKMTKCEGCFKHKSVMHFIRDKWLCRECLFDYMIWLIQHKYAFYLGKGKFDVDKLEGWQYRI